VISIDYRKALGVLFRGMIAVGRDALLMYRIANYYFLYGDISSGISYLRLAHAIAEDYLYKFIEYDERTSNLPQVIETIKELTEKK
jgi:hypothetical protein